VPWLLTLFPSSLSFPSSTFYVYFFFAASLLSFPSHPLAPGPSCAGLSCDIPCRLLLVPRTFPHSLTLVVLFFALLCSSSLFRFLTATRFCGFPLLPGSFCTLDFPFFVYPLFYDLAALLIPFFSFSSPLFCVASWLYFLCGPPPPFCFSAPGHACGSGLP